MRAIGRHVSKLSGYAPALPTPFDADDGIDCEAFERLCDLQIMSGATALVVCGTTGEAPNLTVSEYCELIRIAVRVSRVRVPVIAGAGSNATKHAIELTEDAETNGADAILSVVPYYNRLSQAGLYTHFCEIAVSTALPVILYDVPSRTARGLDDETVARLAEVPQIIGLKDATGDVARPARLRPLVGVDFRLLSGDDATAFAFLTQGGDGCISVTSNAAPALCRSMFLAWRQGEIARAQRFALALTQLTAALFSGPNPVPLKYALSLFDLMSSRVRLPLVELGERDKIEVANVLACFCDEYSGSMIGKIGDFVRLTGASWRGKTHSNLSYGAR
jgi:4-hydroxy-tetrahydrodipicolinate synthase